MSLRNGGLSLVGAFLLGLLVGMEAMAVVFMALFGTFMGCVMEEAWRWFRILFR
jgi:hypothetical protein